MRCLVLNASMLPLNLTPLSTVSWQEAIILVYQDKATVIHEYEGEEHTVRSQHLTLQKPSVVVLKKHVYFKTHAKFSKTNVKIRDEFKCAYCGTVHSKHSLTIDHIHPSSKGGQSEWLNCVSACKPCNHKKGSDKIKPKYVKPYIPTYMDLAKKYVKHMALTNEDWRPYVNYAIGTNRDIGV
jgi:5-methylcytosine-specific restriction endonuclease McrA